MLKIFRLTHLYFGVLIAPAILFFALTGALQTVGLHETNRDHPDYHPAKWIVLLAQIHKKQVAALPQKRPPTAAMGPIAPAATESTPTYQRRDHAGDAEKPAAASAPPVSAQAPAAAAKSPEPPAKAPEPAARKHNPIPLRVFFLLVCLGLFTSTGTGIYMAYKYNRSRLWVSVALAAGVVVPLLLLIP